MGDSISKEFRYRYSRQIAVEGIGEAGQLNLCNAKVMIVGCGALGSMIAMQLAGAGINTIGVADFDNIDVSNLQRQFFFQTSEAGKPKSVVLKERMEALNPDVKIEVYQEMVTTLKAEKIFSDYDFIVDATDNPDSKRMTGEICRKMKKPSCIGGVRDFSGQVMTLLPGDARMEDYFGEGAGEGFLPCSLSGVVGPAAAICASLQASEVIKYFTKTGELLSGKLLTFNLLNNSFLTFEL